MATRNIAAVRTADKPTFIYGLIDPRTQELRYIGKTVLPIAKRLTNHVWNARRGENKRHCLSWIFELLASGGHPEYVIFEEIPIGGDWVEAEQFWIAYFRMLGADLCNHTIGGEGQLGYRQPAEVIAKRVKHGPDHPFYGRPMPENVREALRVGGEALRADPERHQQAVAKRLAGMSEQGKLRAIAALTSAMSNPQAFASREVKRKAAMKREDVRAKIGDASKEMWEVNRDKIVAAQNLGKGEEWRRKHAEIHRLIMMDENAPLRIAAASRRKLSGQDIEVIRLRLASGEAQSEIAKDFNVNNSVVSRINTRHGRFR